MWVWRMTDRPVWVGRVVGFAAACVVAVVGGAFDVVGESRWFEESEVG